MTLFLAGRVQPVRTREHRQADPEAALLQLQHALHPRAEQAGHDPEESASLRSRESLLLKWGVQKGPFSNAVLAFGASFGKSSIPLKAMVKQPLV